MEQNHIINKLVIEISVNNKEKAHEIRDDISSFLNIDVFPKLEKHFNNVLTGLSTLQTLQISELTVNVEESHTSLDTILKDSILDSFEKELIRSIRPALISNENPKTDLKLLAEEDRLLDTFIYFIETGHMPWWYSNEESTIILAPEKLKKVIYAKEFVNRIVHSMQKPKVLERIINQFTDSQIKQICLPIIKSKSAKIILKDNLIKRLSGKTHEKRKKLWLLILNVLTASENNPENYIIKETLKIISHLKVLKNQDSEEKIWELIQSLFPLINQKDNFDTLKKRNVPEISTQKSDNILQKEIQTENDKQAEIAITKDKKNNKTNSFHVPNAGLVLIHSFINNLFRYCNLLDLETKELTDPELCVHLLHYIATGKTNQPESNMLFEKFLCNIPLHQSINRHVKLSRKHKSEAAKVIAAVQENWSSMKTSSVSLLQNEFFQRSGKLIIDDNLTLTIERKTQDILLDKLSWGISFIKLPWQKKFIYVNW